MPGARAVFLDRDGTLNQQFIRDGAPYPPATVEELSLFPDVPAGCARLKAAGYLLVVATNQPDVGRGTQALATVETMHRRLQQLLPQLDRIEACYDSGREPVPSGCRKPAPGMLLKAAADLRIDLKQSWMIGDRWRDIDCGHAAGCRTIFIDWGYAETLRQRPDFVVRSFAEAVAIVLAPSDT